MCKLYCVVDIQTFIRIEEKYIYMFSRIKPCDYYYCFILVNRHVHMHSHLSRPGVLHLFVHVSPDRDTVVAGDEHSNRNTLLGGTGPEHVQKKMCFR